MFLMTLYMFTSWTWSVMNSFKVDNNLYIRYILTYISFSFCLNIHYFLWLTSPISQLQVSMFTLSLNLLIAATITGDNFISAIERKKEPKTITYAHHERCDFFITFFLFLLHLIAFICSLSTTFLKVAKPDHE